jgi:hypothetical protein
MRTIKVNENKVKVVNGYNCQSLIGKKHFENGKFLGYCMFGVTTNDFPLIAIFETEKRLNDEMTRIINSDNKFEEVR